MSYRLMIPILFLAHASFAQSLQTLIEQAPPDVDQALRANVAKFYQAHVEGKFRAADQFVAEDSKDTFFAMEKRRCRSFDIVTIQYSDEFKKARVAIRCDTDMVMTGKRLPVKMPIPSKWKLTDGRWEWYVDPRSDKGRVTAFGVMKPGPMPDATKRTAPSPVSLEGVTKLVSADKRKVVLEPSSDWTAQVTITNRMPGGVSLSTRSPSVRGLELQFDRTELKSSESARLTVRFDPSAGKPPSFVRARIMVMPTQRLIPLTIQFAPKSPAGVPAK